MLQSFRVNPREPSQKPDRGPIMEKTSLRWIVLAGAVVACGLLTACGPAKTSVADNAGGRRPEEFPEITADVFKPLDNGIQLTADEVKGRNTWNLWCGGNEQF